MQAAIFVNPESQKQDSIKAVINKIEKNIAAMNQDPAKYASEILEKDIYFSDLGLEIMTNSIPKSNLSFLKAKENKTDIEKYLTMIGYKLPDEKFYN